MQRYKNDMENRLEHALRKYTALTEGQRLPIIHNDRVYPLYVEAVKPSPAGHLIDTNLQVEFSAWDRNHSIKNDENKSEEKGDGKTDDGDDDDDGMYDEAQALSLYTPVNEIISADKNTRGLYYKIKIANPNYPVRCVLSIKKGDGNVYAHSSHDKPNITRYLWCNETESNEKEIYVSSKDPNFQKWIYFGIQSFNCDLFEFEFFVDQES